MSIDIVLCTVPYIEFDLPPAAPATLKGHLESKGFKAETLDLNIMVKEFFGDNQDDLSEITSYFIKSISICHPRPLVYDLSSQALVDKLDRLVSIWCKAILAKKPKWIGFSVFSRDSRVACKLLCEKLATIKHDSKILIGGPGVENDEWVEDMRPLIDVYVQGEGELVLENLLKGNLNFKGINGKADTIEDLDDMVERLADYNHKSGAGIKWGGFYIVRKKKALPRDYFSLTSASGAHNFALGVESGSNSVLEHMKKQFTMDDLDNFIENFSQHNIRCSYLMIIGYPTETDEDFEQSLELFYRHQKYVADGTIIGATLGSTLAIYPGMPLWNERGTLIELDESNKVDARIGWTSKVVPHLNWEERLKRRLTAEEVCKMLKWPLLSRLRELPIIHNANEYHKKWKQGILKTSTKRVVDQNHMVQV